MSNLDGGTAFPTDNARYTDTFGTTLKHCSTGMSLRDWFAGMALNGLMANSNLKEGIANQQLAKVAYHMADDMIKAKGEK